MSSEHSKFGPTDNDTDTASDIYSGLRGAGPRDLPTGMGSSRSKRNGHERMEVDI